MHVFVIHQQILRKFIKSFGVFLKVKDGYTLYVEVLLLGQARQEKKGLRIYHFA